MSGLLEGPEHRNDRVAEEVSGVFSASPFSPMTQPADDGGRATLRMPAGLSGPSQTAKRSDEMPGEPPPAGPDRLNARQKSHCALGGSEPSPNGQISQWIPGLDTKVERLAPKDHQVALRERQQQTSGKRNIRCNTTRRSRRPTTGPRQTSLAPKRDSRQEPSQHHTHVQQVAVG